MLKSGIPLALALMLALVSASVQAADSKPLRIGVSNWAPYKSSELAGGGIVVDILRRALKRAGYETEIRYAPWKRTLRGAIIGTYDVIPAIWETPERAESLVFSDPVITSRIVIISHAAMNFQFDSLADLSGKTVGTASGWAYPDRFVEARDIIKEEVGDLDTNLKKLIFGRIKFTIAEEIAARHTVNAKFKGSAHLFRYSEKSLRDSHLRVAFSKKRPDAQTIAQQFNAAMSSMRADGTMDTILAFHGVLK